MFTIENYEVVLVPSESEDDVADGTKHPDALALLEHDIIVTFDQADWPASIPAGVLVPEPCLDAKLDKSTLSVHCPIKGSIEVVNFINVPDEVAELLKQAGRLTLAGLNENGVVWEQTIPL